MTTPTPEQVPAHQRRADALRRAAKAKRQAATRRAENAIRHLIKERQEINFRAVARAGGVSLDFLYANPELRGRIETLRAQQTAQPRPSIAPADSDGSIVHILTTKLRDERTARSEAVRDLERRLAAAHGEILRLRRVLHLHNVRT
jgi:hypothetical protein